jgi:hypothetical protein
MSQVLPDMPLARAGSKLGLATVAGFHEAGTGLAGLFSWVVAALADRDLFFQDLHILSDSAP